MLSGNLPDIFDRIRENLKFCPFYSLEIVLWNYENFFQKLIEGKSSFALCQHMNGEQLSRKESSLNIHATPYLTPAGTHFHLCVPGKSQKSMHMPYEKNLTKKKYLQINKKQLKTIPNTK